MKMKNYRFFFYNELSNWAFCFVAVWLANCVSSRLRVEKCACRWGITWANGKKNREKNGAKIKLFNRIDLMIYLTLTCTSKCSVIVIDWYFKMNSHEPTPLVIPSHFIRLINRILIIILFILASIYDNHNIFHLCANCLFANFIFGSLPLPFIGCILMSLKYIRFCCHIIITSDSISHIMFYVNWPKRINQLAMHCAHWMSKKKKFKQFLMVFYFMKYQMSSPIYSYIDNISDCIN